MDITWAPKTDAFPVAFSLNPFAVTNGVATIIDFRYIGFDSDPTKRTTVAAIETVSGTVRGALWFDPSSPSFCAAALSPTKYGAAFVGGPGSSTSPFAGDSFVATLLVGAGGITVSGSAWYGANTFGSGTQPPIAADMQRVLVYRATSIPSLVSTSDFTIETSTLGFSLFDTLDVGFLGIGANDLGILGDAETYTSLYQPSGGVVEFAGFDKTRRDRIAWGQDSASSAGTVQLVVSPVATAPSGVVPTIVGSVPYGSPYPGFVFNDGVLGVSVDGSTLWSIDVDTRKTWKYSAESAFKFKYVLYVDSTMIIADDGIGNIVRVKRSAMTPATLPM